jgi:hypothetical protein
MTLAAITPPIPAPSRPGGDPTSIVNQRMAGQKGTRPLWITAEG